jgi:hypothetical protein
MFLFKLLRRHYHELVSRSKLRELATHMLPKLASFYPFHYVINNVKFKFIWIWTLAIFMSRLMEDHRRRAYA